jgi:organic radical activating enzyme
VKLDSSGSVQYDMHMTDRQSMAKIAEIFSSIQGEGRWVGRRQVFVRLASCNLNCAYCDTKINTATEMSAIQVANKVKLLVKPLHSHHSISLTGGEPLLAGAGFINSFASAVADTGLPVHLETNGTLPDVLREVIGSLTFLSMDIKIPSATGEPPQYEANRRFLEIAGAKECCVKVVFTPESNPDEIETAVNIVAEVDSTIPFILQPATPVGDVKKFPAQDLMISLYDLAAGVLKDVRVIPQIHRFLGLR